MIIVLLIPNSSRTNHSQSRSLLCHCFKFSYLHYYHLLHNNSDCITILSELVIYKSLRQWFIVFTLNKINIILRTGITPLLRPKTSLNYICHCTYSGRLTGGWDNREPLVWCDSLHVQCSRFNNNNITCLIFVHRLSEVWKISKDG